MKNPGMHIVGTAEENMEIPVYMKNEKSGKAYWGYSSEEHGNNSI